MASKINHQHIYKPGSFGGVVNTTLCGRVDNSTDDRNVSDAVTCKFCRRMIEANVSPRLKWIGWKPTE